MRSGVAQHRRVVPLSDNDGVTAPDVDDRPDARKARGAFFTPAEIARYVARWAIRAPGDRVLEPSAGDAAFLVQAADALKDLGAAAPVVDGVEIHRDSAATARARVRAAGGSPRVRVADFFTVAPAARYDAVIGNPPFIRYQDFRGELRARSRAAALRGGVALSGLASSWAAFTVHAAQFVAPGGRLGLVLPAELLSVNYAAPVRKFLFDSFASVELVLFDEQVFPEAEADVVLLLADGFGAGPAGHATLRPVQNTEALTGPLPGRRWRPVDAAAKWVSGLVPDDPVSAVTRAVDSGAFTPLQAWGDTTLGMVTGNNGYFALPTARVNQLGLAPTDVVRLSPPGSAHLRGLALSTQSLGRLDEQGKAVHLFWPGTAMSRAARRYVQAGEEAGVHLAYKCRVRSPWYLVPLAEPADLLLTCMNADTARIVANLAGVHHLNSVHGVYLRAPLRRIGRDLLPIATLNSVTLLDAELVGRSYGGGILKIEPREADRWAVPSAQLLAERSAQLRAARRTVTGLLGQGRLLDAVEVVDRALALDGIAGPGALEAVRAARTSLTRRRLTRSRRGR